MPTTTGSISAISASISASEAPSTSEVASEIASEMAAISSDLFGAPTPADWMTRLISSAEAGRSLLDPPASAATICSAAATASAMGDVTSTPPPAASAPPSAAPAAPAASASAPASASASASVAEAVVSSPAASTASCCLRTTLSATLRQMRSMCFCRLRTPASRQYHRMSSSTASSVSDRCASVMPICLRAAGSR